MNWQRKALFSILHLLAFSQYARAFEDGSCSRLLGAGVSGYVTREISPDDDGNTVIQVVKNYKLPEEFRRDRGLFGLLEFIGFKPGHPEFVFKIPLIEYDRRMNRMTFENIEGEDLHSILKSDSNSARSAGLKKQFLQGIQEIQTQLLKRNVNMKMRAALQENKLKYFRDEYNDGLDVFVFLTAPGANLAMEMIIKSDNIIVDKLDHMYLVDPY